MKKLSTRTVVPLTGRTHDELMYQIHNAPDADMLEWRADSYAYSSDAPRLMDELLSLRSATDKDLIFTHHKNPQAIMLALSSGLCAAADADISLFGDGTLLHAPRSENTLLMCSSHIFEPVPKEAFAPMLRELTSVGADMAKLALYVQKPEDSVELMYAARDAGKRSGMPVTAIAMGDSGVFSRIAAPYFASAFNYVAGATSKNAPGQLELSECACQKDLLCDKGHAVVLIGSPASHSASPRMHNAFYTGSGIDACYIPLDVPSWAAKDVFTALRSERIRGAAVTMPYKRDALKYADSLDRSAAACGAVNTLVNDNGTLTGFNTDGAGFMRAMTHGGISLKNAALLSIGAGGAARAVCSSVAGVAKKVYICSPSDSCESLCASLRCAPTEFIPVRAGDTAALCAAAADSDIILNLSGVGMSAHVSPLPKEYISPRHICFDAAYEPKKTRFLECAEEAGASVLNGETMLAFQAAEQIRLWFGVNADADDLLLRRS